ncbi:DUF503 domain-containing protein [Peptoniphilus equinus]|uniref:DUF503 domain-containing protein n=1 Tax=Peptoniphilus equinus TaxID=3016343 RepID=A0ABY7QT58_9FIRM|nr:DUF503 domain-containing protein [Peptoniphilus equinus]WBW49470.1 DUF503 domain-containing protein [Peptoniphilus equinus]
MLVGRLEIQLRLFECHSLKDKRSVIQSIVRKIEHRFPVSIAEVGHTESLERSTIGIAVVSNGHRHIEAVLDKCVDFIEFENSCEIIETEIEID